jgi:hypothetical protein
MADNDKLNAFLTQLAEFDPGTLDALSFTREQFGDVFGNETFGQLFNPMGEKNPFRGSGFTSGSLSGDLILGADIGERSQFGLDPTAFFQSLLQSGDEGAIRAAFGDKANVPKLLAGFNKFLQSRGLGDLGSLRTTLQDRLGLLDDPPFQTTNEITEQNPLGQSPFARTPTAQPTTPGNTAMRVRQQDEVIKQGRDALRQLQAVPASQLNDEQRRQRELEVERQTLERRKTLGSKPSVGAVSVASRVPGVRTDLGKVV